MKEGLEEFLKRIEAKPTNETLIDRFVTLVLEEDVLERILYLKKLVGLLLTPNPYAALKAAALELQEARKEKLTREYEVGALKDVESCFLKLEKMENAQLVRDEINKLQADAARESTQTRGRTPPQIPLPDREDMDESPARQARVHYRLPSRPPDPDADMDEERTQQHRPQEAMDNLPPPSPRPTGRTVPPTMPEPLAAPLAPSEADFNAEAFGYTPRRKEGTASSIAGQKQKEFYDKGLEETDDMPGESTRRSSLSKVSGLKVGPNLLETPEDQEPPRPRNIQSVFDATDVFAPKEKPAPEEKRPKADKTPKPMKEATRSKSRLFDGNDYGDSNSLFQESQHVHFPENTANRSMTRQEARSIAAHLQHDMTGTSAVAAAPMENTEILPESKMANAIPFDAEATRQLDPEELAMSIVPPEPAFPPREFDVPPFDFAPTKADGKATKNKSKDPFAAVRDQPAIGNREVVRDFGREGTNANPVGGRDFGREANAGRDAMGREFGRDNAANATQRDGFGTAANAIGGREPNAGRDAMGREFGRDPNPAPQAGRDATANAVGGRDNNALANRDAAAPREFGRDGNAAGGRDNNPPNANREFGREGNAAPIPVPREFPSGDNDDGVFAPLRPARDPFAEANDPFAGMREPPPAKDPIPFPKEAMAKAAPPSAPASSKPAPAAEPRWSLLRDRLRLLTGLQISRSHASEFVLRLLGENSSREEQHEVLSILMRVLEGPRQPLAEQRFLAFLFEELQPKALHQLLGALKIGDQTVVFFVDYLNSLMRERQLRRTLNVIHAVIIPGLDLSWYQESYRYLMQIWPELGLKGWHWLEEEGPMVFCDRLALREDLLPATLLA